MRILLIVLSLLTATAAHAQIFGPEDTPERVAQIRSHCDHQPDPPACHQYLDSYEPTRGAWRQQMDYLERSLNSGFTSPGGQQRYQAPAPAYRPPQYIVQQHYMVRRPTMCWYRGRLVPCY